MKMIHAVLAGVLASATLVCAPFDIAANAHGSGFGTHGFGAHSFHIAKHFRSAHHHRNLNQWPWYGGYGGLYTVPPYAFDNNNSNAGPGTVVYVSEPPRARNCQSSQEVKTVPSESGGTREITITRLC